MGISRRLPRRRGAGIFLAVLLCCHGAPALSCALTRGTPLVPGRIADGQSLTLADGREVRLAGIEAPGPSDGRSAAGWAKEARVFLAHLVGRDAVLAYEGAREDRHGRILASPLGADGQSAQARLVEAGLVRVRSTADNRGCIGELLALEEKARADRRGIWSDPAYAIVDAGDVAALLRAEGRFVIVEGVVRAAASVRGRLYFNFGEDRRTDFTVTVAPADARLFKTGAWASIRRDPSGVVGRRMRVRGFIESYNGPEIVLTHPEQVEFSEQGKEPANGGASKSGKKNSRS